MYTFTAPQPESLIELMPALFNALAGRRKIALYGEMGAGKTALVKAFAQYLGVSAPTASPTFALVNEYAYPNADGGEGLIRHLDLYRLERPGEAADIGIEDMLWDDSYCLIEWPQVAEPFFPDNMARITVVVLESGVREITVA